MMVKAYIYFPFDNSNYMIMPIANTRFSLGLEQKNVQEPEELQTQLVEYYAKHHPNARVQPRSTIMLGGSGNVVSRKFTYYKYFILDGRRIPASDLGTKAPNSLVQTKFNNCCYVGQVIKIFTHRQARVEKSTALVQVKWFVPFTEIEDDVSPWKD